MASKKKYRGSFISPAERKENGKRIIARMPHVIDQIRKERIEEVERNHRQNIRKKKFNHDYSFIRGKIDVCGDS